MGEEEVYKVTLMEDNEEKEGEEEAAGIMDDPFAMMAGMGEEEVYKVTLMEDNDEQEVVLVENETVTKLKPTSEPISAPVATDVPERTMPEVATKPIAETPQESLGTACIPEPAVAE